MIEPEPSPMSPLGVPVVRIAALAGPPAPLTPEYLAEAGQGGFRLDYHAGTSLVQYFQSHHHKLVAAHCYVRGSAFAQ